MWFRSFLAPPKFLSVVRFRAIIPLSKTVAYPRTLCAITHNMKKTNKLYSGLGLTIILIYLPIASIQFIDFLIKGEYPYYLFLTLYSLISAPVLMLVEKIGLTTMFTNSPILLNLGIITLILINTVFYYIIGWLIEWKIVFKKKKVTSPNSV
jgi:hypothetical protein